MNLDKEKALEAFEKLSPEQRAAIILWYGAHLNHYEENVEYEAVETLHEYEGYLNNIDNGKFINLYAENFKDTTWQRFFNDSDEIPDDITEKGPAFERNNGEISYVYSHGPATEYSIVQEDNIIYLTFLPGGNHHTKDHQLNEDAMNKIAKNIILK